jgi:hypothetical protein
MIEHKPAMLLKMEQFNLHPWIKRALQERTNVTAIYDSLPLEEMIMLDTLSDGELPGLRWVLRRQRGRYLLTLMHPKHLDKGAGEVQGEP